MALPDSGALIVFVGIDGCGKGTQIELLKARLTSEGLGDRLVFSKQPGGTPVGLEIRRILFETVGSKNMSPLTYQVLCAASHVESCASILQPALDAGKIVICDRWHPFCSHAYDGEYRFPIKSIEPDVVIHMWGEPQTFLERALNRKTEAHQQTKNWNQVEKLVAIQGRYTQMLSKLPGYLPICADSHPPEHIAEFVYSRLLRRLNGSA